MTVYSRKARLSYHFILRTFLWVLLFSSTINSTLSGSPVALEPDQDETYIFNLEYLEDATGDISHQLAKDSTTIYKEYNGDPSVLDPSIEVYWVKILVDNPQPHPREVVIDFGNWVWKEISFYNGNNTPDSQPLKTGPKVPYKQRDYPVANQGYILQELPPSSSNEYLVRLDARSKYSYSIGSKVPFIRVADRHYADKVDANRKLWIGIFASIFLFMFVYHAFVMVSTWDMSYLLYLGLVFSYGFMTMANSGYIFELFQHWDYFPKIFPFLNTVIPSLSGILTILFTIELLDTKVNLPKLHKLLVAVMFVPLIVMIGQIFISYSFFMRFTMATIVIIMITITIVGIASVIKKIPSAKYFLLAYAFSIYGSCVAGLTLGGALPLTDYNILYSAPLGWTLEILFFAFAIANIINVLKKKHEESQQNYISQLEENRAIIAKVNDELEQKVKERTEELQEERDALEAEKVKSENLLLNILPKDTAEELKQTGEAKPKFIDQAAVMFTDFKDFTSLSEQLSHLELVNTLDELFKAFDRIISKRGLEKIKTIGDSYMCVGGLDPENKNFVNDTVMAALEIIDEMEKWNKKRITLGLDPWYIRTGIHVGPITSGVVGEKKFAFDIWGDTVNVASRIETQCEPGKLNISKSTYDNLENGFSFTYRGKIKVKNKGEIDMYYVSHPN